MIRPETITIDTTVLNLVAGLDEYKGRWQLLRKLAPDVPYR